MQKVKLGDISKLNAETFKNNFNKIYYFDTSSVTKGRFEKYSLFKNSAKLPSRAKRAVKDKTIVYSTVRPNLKHFGIFKKPSENIVVSTGFTTIDVKDFVDAEYIYYFLTQNSLTNKLHTIASNNVSSYPSIKPSDLENIELTLPTLLVQQKISKVLSNIDDKIELNHKINIELEQMACQIYEYWFLQFDFPDRNGGPYKSSGGKMVYNQELKREIPEGWRVKKLGDIGIKVIRGVSFSKKDIVEKNKNSIGILRGTNISGNQIDVNNLLYVDKRFITEEQKIKAMDLLITMSSGSKEHVGKNGFYYFDKKDISFGAFLSKIVIPEKYRFLIGIYFQTKNFKTYLDNQILGTSINNVSNEMISSIKICIPSEQILSHFENLVKPIFQKIMRNMQQSQELVELRDYLLPLLMNGQINVD